MGGLLADNEDAHGEVDDSTPKNRDPATTESDGVVSSGVTPSEPKKASWLLVALLFWCGVGTFARTEVFVLQTRYFSLCAGYGKDYFPESAATMFMPPIFFLWLETKVAPLLIVRLGSRMYALARVFAATMSSVLVLVVYGVLFSPGQHTHPDPWGFYTGLVVIGWGASATYESVTSVVSVLSPACFAAFFVGTYSAAIVFLPVNLATGALCGDGHFHEGEESSAEGHAVAWQFATSAFLVLVGAAAFLSVTQQPQARAEFKQMDAEVDAIIGRRRDNDSIPRPLTKLQRLQLQHWITTRNINADRVQWLKQALELGVIAPRTWKELRVGRTPSDLDLPPPLPPAKTAPAAITVVQGRASNYASEESPTDDAASATLATTVHDSNASSIDEDSVTASDVPQKDTVSTPKSGSDELGINFLEVLRACWQPAGGVFANTVTNLIVTGMYVRLGATAVALFYEFYLGTALGAMLTLSKTLKGYNISTIFGGILLRMVFLPVVLVAAFIPGSINITLFHAINVPWTILGGYCYTMMWIKSSVIEGGSRVMPVVYFVGMSIGILILIILNEHEKSNEE